MSLPAFPLTNIAYPVKRSSEVQGVNLQAWSGRRTWLPSWQYPMYHYEVPFNVLRNTAAATWQNMQGFWNVVQTSPGGYFTYHDVEDFTVPTDQVFGIGDGVTTTFQLVRALGGFVDPVRVPNITNIKNNGTITGAYTVGVAGRITFTSAPLAGHTLAWNGTFDWLCQFDKTTMDFENFAYQYWNLKTITFQTAQA